MFFINTVSAADHWPKEQQMGQGLVLTLDLTQTPSK